MTECFEAIAKGLPIVRIGRDLEIQNVKLLDALIAPGFALAENDEYAIWNWVRSFNKHGLSGLPTNLADCFLLSVIRGENSTPIVQVHDGNHRFIALAIYEPDLVIGDIFPYIKFIHYKELTTEDARYLESVDHHVPDLSLRYWFNEKCRFNISVSITSVVDLGQFYRTKDIVELTSKRPISFRDPSIFITKPSTVGFHSRGVLLSLIHKAENKDEYHFIESLKRLLCSNDRDSHIPYRRIITLKLDQFPNRPDNYENFVVAGSFTRWSHSSNNGPFHLPMGSYEFKYYNTKTTEWFPEEAINYTLIIKEDNNGALEALFS